MKKNTFNKNSLHDRFKSFDSTLTFINKNVLDATNDICPLEKERIAAKRRYTQFQRMVNEKPKSKMQKVLTFLKDHKEALFSYFIFFSFILYIIAFFYVLGLVTK